MNSDKKRTRAMIEEQGVHAQQELVGAQFTFRVITIDGGKTLNIELPIPRYVGMLIFLFYNTQYHQEFKSELYSSTRYDLLACMY